jgi:hypothetical protein
VEFILKLLLTARRRTILENAIVTQTRYNITLPSLSTYLKSISLSGISTKILEAFLASFMFHTSFLPQFNYPRSIRLSRGLPPYHGDEYEPQ